ncbi:MAG: acyl carrier protein [Saprospiraceae bacterium]|jgi:acyl carrier protein
MNDVQLRTLLINTLSKYAKNKEVLTDAKDDVDLRNDLKIQSARLVDVVLDLEVELDIEIEPDDMDKMFSIGETMEMLKKYLPKT